MNRRFILNNLAKLRQQKTIATKVILESPRRKALADSEKEKGNGKENSNNSPQSPAQKSTEEPGTHKEPPEKVDSSKQVMDAVIVWGRDISDMRGEVNLE